MAPICTHEDQRGLRVCAYLLVALLVWGAWDLEHFGVVFLCYRLQVTAIDFCLLTFEVRLARRRDKLCQGLFAVPPVLEHVQEVLFLQYFLLQRWVVLQVSELTHLFRPLIVDLAVLDESDGGLNRAILGGLFVLVGHQIEHRGAYLHVCEEDVEVFFAHSLTDLTQVPHQLSLVLFLCFESLLEILTLFDWFFFDADEEDGTLFTLEHIAVEF